MHSNRLYTAMYVNSNDVLSTSDVAVDLIKSPDK